VPFIFDPFYTTLRAEGHMGLGLHIIYNMITQTLAGSMSYQEQTEGGHVLLLSYLKHYNQDYYQHYN
jgi:C4-dicarboxylate-specific signal transduction histidine kinase